MTYRFKTVLIFASILSCFSTFGLSYLGVNGNLSKVSYEPMSKYNVEPIGLGVGYLFGMRSGFAGIEFSYSGLKAKGKIRHDSADNTIIHTQGTYAAMLNLYLNPRLYFKFGYALYKVDHTLENGVTSAKEASIKDIYGMMNSSKGGLAYGLSFDFFKVNRGFNLYTSIDRYAFDKLGTTTSIQFGAKFLFDFGFQSLFSR